MRTFRDTYLLYIGVVVALVPVMVLRDFTPDNELRYLSIADEALRQHAYFAFTNHGVPYADTTRLQHALGYRPSVSVADGVARFYDWYRAYAHVE